MKYATFDEAGVISGRYDSVVHASIPEGAIALPDKLWIATTRETDGVWTLRDGEVVKLPPLEALPDVSALVETARLWRDAEIDRVAWIRDRHRDEIELGASTSITAEQFSELLGYIQQLRDWPQRDEFPGESSRPVVPDWVATQTQ